MVRVHGILVFMSGPGSTGRIPRFDDAFRGQLVELFRWRRDVRRFRSDPVPETVFNDLLHVAALAPSVGLSQPWRFVTVDDPGRRSAIRDSFQLCNTRALAALEGDDALAYAKLKLAGLEEAPRHLAVFAEADPQQGRGLGRRTMPETTTYSAVMAVHTIWLMARAAGLGLGWVSILDPASVHAALDVSAEWRFVGYLCIGYPAAQSDTPELERCGWEHRRPGAVRLIRR